MEFREFGIAIFVAGGLLVFQTSEGLDAPKIAYMLASLVAVAAASARLFAERAAILGESLLTAWLSVSVTFGTMVAISLPVAVANGTHVATWLRDATPYAMFAFAIVLAIDGRSVPRSHFVAALVATGLLAAASFSIEWTSRRGILEFPLQRLVLPSGILASTLVAYAAARSITGRRSFRWIVLCGTVLGLFVITGTRSTLLLFAVPCVVAVASRRSPRRIIGVSGGIFAVALSTTVLFWITVVGVPALLTVDSVGQSGHNGAPPLPDPIGERIGSIGSAISNPAGDASFAERIAQTRAAWEVVLQHPLLGAGPGVMFPWESAFRGPQSSFTLDTPLTFPAKFGLVGMVALVWLAVVVLVTLKSHRQRGAEIDFLTLVGFPAVFVIARILNSPFEDKGLSFAVLLVLGASFAWSPESQPSRVEARAGADAVAATQ